MRRPLAALAGAALLAALAAASGACSSATTQCDCADPAITISIPSDIAPSVTRVLPSGPACTGVEARCTNQTGGCSQYRVVATAAGDCKIDVDFATGRVFEASVPVAASTESCCSGFYPTPASAGQVAVPSPDGGA